MKIICQSRDSEKPRDRLSEKSSSDRKEKKAKREKEKDRLSNIDGGSNADYEADQRRLEKRLKEKEERKKLKEKKRQSEGVSLEMKEKLKKEKRKTIATSDGKDSHRNGNENRWIKDDSRDFLEHLCFLFKEYVKTSGFLRRRSASQRRSNRLR